jgi:hypothetical protein
MFQRVSFVLIPAIAVLFLAREATAGPLPAEVVAKIKQVFPVGQITGKFREKPDILEVFFQVPDSPIIEVVFKRKGGHWHLIGYELPIIWNQVPPQVLQAIKAKYPHPPQPGWSETELYFDASWQFKCYVITVAGKEDFILPSGQWTTDPEK